jgi:hypothetical protein
MHQSQLTDSVGHKLRQDWAQSFRDRILTGNPTAHRSIRYP